MLDLQRVEDEKLLQLPRLNPVAMILDVLADRELPQVVLFVAVYYRHFLTRVCAAAPEELWPCG